MKYTFKAKIYKTGINGCVDVPSEVTKRLTIDKGRVRIKGKINGFDFSTTLMPVKDAQHRLFVNHAMMRGAQTGLGQTATFKIEQDTKKVQKEYPSPPILAARLKEHQLTAAFNQLTTSRKQDILKYLNYVKTEATLLKNIDKLINQLKSKVKQVRIP